MSRVCKRDGCDVSLEGRRSQTRYCSSRCRARDTERRARETAQSGFSAAVADETASAAGVLDAYRAHQARKADERRELTPSEMADAW